MALFNISSTNTKDILHYNARRLNRCAVGEYILQDVILQVYVTETTVTVKKTKLVPIPEQYKVPLNA